MGSTLGDNIIGDSCWGVTPAARPDKPPDSGEGGTLLPMELASGEKVSTSAVSCGTGASSEEFEISNASGLPKEKKPAGPSACGLCGFDAEGLAHKTRNPQDNFRCQYCLFRRLYSKSRQLIPTQDEMH